MYKCQRIRAQKKKYYKKNICKTITWKSLQPLKVSPDNSTMTFSQSPKETVIFPEPKIELCEPV